MAQKLGSKAAPVTRKATPKTTTSTAAKSAGKAAAKTTGKATGKTVARKAAKAATKTSVKAAAKGRGKKTGTVAASPAQGGSPRNLNHSSGHKGISRVDSLKRNSHGWYVRVPWNSEMQSRFFSDSAHGGREMALAKAIRARNRLERELGKPRTDRVVMIAQQRNESGILGVHKILKEGAPVYEVTWSPEPNVIKRTSVSIRKYGEEGALRRAIVIRRRKEREVFGAAIREAP